ncbi:DUF4355 domain-containing protein [Leuconostoc pseudomesenteroides]|uniref:DUF4355 domain-containing protein n=1 Tax=Leuconostoc pseudomesenteroides TaxID=33968 RepID=UPI0021A5C8D3|nr:DUF4355 domain-containing protein [Leuconostoc pseudomesenteroides]MCT4379983.1 DUF4355 domain-containing protein [Leuconostoc pseudomesenteroides]
MADEVNTEETNTGTETTDNQEQTETQDDKLTFTPKEFDSEVDKRIANALQTAKAKWDEEKQTEISNAEKLAKMSAAERKEAEDKAKQETLDKREKELNMREYRYEAKHQLEENGLPDSFVDMVLSEDAETTKNNIGAIKAEFDKAVEAAVNEKLKGNNPKAGGRTGALTKSEILKVADTVERQKLIAENINLFK